MRSLLFVAFIFSISACSRRQPDPAPKLEKSDVPKENDNAINANELDLFKIGDGVFKRYQAIGYSELSLPEKVFLCVWDLEGEIYNGGFGQYYYNSSGNHACDAVDALRAIGANQTAEIVRKANALFGDEGPAPNRGDRRSELLLLSDASKKKMEEYEKEFVTDKERIQELLSRYVSAKSASFKTR
jgi:hypothetical protein